MKIVKIACAKCGKKLDISDAVLLPFAHSKKIAKIMWGCVECRMKIGDESDASTR